MSGGGALSFGKNDSESTARDLTPGVFRQQRGQVAQTLLDRIRGNVPEIEGPFAAGLTPEEQGALSDFQQSAFGPTGLGAATEDYIRQTLAGAEQSPFLDETIQAATRPILENAELDELRDRAGFTQAGQKIQSSSAFAGERARSIRDTERQVSDVATQLAAQDYDRRQALQVEAANMAQARIGELRESISALALPRMVEQYGLDRANEELARRYQVIEDDLALLSQLVSPTPVVTQRSGGFSFGTSGGGGVGGGKGGSGG